MALFILALIWAIGGTTAVKAGEDRGTYPEVCDKRYVKGIYGSRGSGHDDARGDSVKVDPGCLGTLDLRTNLVDDRGMKELMIYLIEHNMPVHTLILSRNSIMDEGAKAIAEMIQDPGNKLVTIKLSDNRVGAAGAAALAKATTSTHSKVEVLDLYNNWAKNEGGIAFADALKSGTGCSLQRLDIGSNRIHDDGALAIASALNQLSQSNLIRIAVQGNKFTAEARAIVTNAFKQFKARASDAAEDANDRQGQPIVGGSDTGVVDIDALFDKLRLSDRVKEANGLRNLDDVVVLHAVKMLSALESAMPKIAWRRLSADNAVAALDIAALQLKSRTWPDKDAPVDAWGRGFHLSEASIKTLGDDFGAEHPADLMMLEHDDLNDVTPPAQQAWMRYGLATLRRSALSEQR